MMADHHAQMGNCITRCLGNSGPRARAWWLRAHRDRGGWCCAECPCPNKSPWNSLRSVFWQIVGASFRGGPRKHTPNARKTALDTNYAAKTDRSCWRAAVVTCEPLGPLADECVCYSPLPKQRTQPAPLRRAETECRKRLARASLTVKKRPHEEKRQAQQCKRGGMDTGRRPRGSVGAPQGLQVAVGQPSNSPPPPRRTHPGLPYSGVKHLRCHALFRTLLASANSLPTDDALHVPNRSWCGCWSTRAAPATPPPSWHTV